MLVLYNQLRLFAARRYSWPLDSHDLVMQAFEDVFSGKRSWNPNFPPYISLRLIIRSIAHNRLRKNPPEVSLSANACGSDIPCAKPSPLAAHERAEGQRQLERAFDNLASEDSAVSRVITVARELGEWKASRIAEQLGVDKSVVYNAKKRIKTQLKSQLDEK